MSYRTVLRKVREHDLEGVPKYREWPCPYGGRRLSRPRRRQVAGSGLASGALSLSAEAHVERQAVDLELRAGEGEDPREVGPELDRAVRLDGRRGQQPGGGPDPSPTSL